MNSRKFYLGHAIRGLTFKFHFPIRKNKSFPQNGSFQEIFTRLVLTLYDITSFERSEIAYTQSDCRIRTADSNLGLKFQTVVILHLVALKSVSF